MPVPRPCRVHAEQDIARLGGIIFPGGNHHQGLANARAYKAFPGGGPVFLTDVPKGGFVRDVFAAEPFADEGKRLLRVFGGLM